MSFLKKVRRKKGFTLIELMIVIAIIAILAAIAIPQYNAYKKKSKAKDLVGLARNCAMEIVAQCQLNENQNVDLSSFESCTFEDDLDPYISDANVGYTTTGGASATSFEDIDNSTATVSCTTIKSGHFAIAAQGTVDDTKYSVACEVGTDYSVECRGIQQKDVGL